MDFNYNSSSSVKNRGNLVLKGVVLLIFIYIGRVQELFLFLFELGIGKFFVGLTIILYILSPSKNKKFGILVPFQSKCLAGIFLFGLLSVPLSYSPSYSLKFLSFDVFKLFVFYFLIYKTVNDFDDFHTLNWALIISLFFLSLSASLNTTVFRSTASLLYDPNDIALVMVTSLPLVYSYMVSKNRGGRLFIALVGLFMIYTIIRSVSRGGMLGLIAVSYLILTKERSIKLSYKVIIFSIVAVFFFTMATSKYWARIETIRNISQYTSPYERTEIWKRGVEMLIRHPISGVGIGCFATAHYVSYVSQGLRSYVAPHNAFIEMGAEIGIAGLLLFVALILYSILDLRRLEKLAPTNAAIKENLSILRGLEIGLYGYSVCGFFLTSAYAPILYFFVAQIAVLRKLQKLHSTDPDKSNVTSA